MPRPSVHVVALADYADRYLEQAAAMTYPQLRERQYPPFASLGFGGAGIAYALWRAARAGRGADYLTAARRWSGEAWAARAESTACRVRRMPALPGSAVIGNVGLAYVEVVVGRHERIVDLVRAATPRAGARVDFMFGLAGRLAAIASLVATPGIADDPRLRVLGDRIARTLLAARVPAGFVAHGRAGIEHALIRWSRATGFALPARALDRRVRFADAAEPYACSWCNGSTGLAILHAGAYEHARRPADLAAARRAFAHADTTPGGAGHLCCGVGGVAYAALALHRIAPSTKLVRRARELALIAIQQLRTPHPNGLFEGHPGLVCLALDLVSEQPQGFPLVEA